MTSSTSSTHDLESQQQQNRIMMMLAHLRNVFVLLGLNMAFRRESSINNRKGGAV